jgi:hypothetical protein
MKTILAIPVVLSVISQMIAAESSITVMAAGFREPGNEARPRAYWNWLHGDVSLPDLTRDMEEAKAKGLGGLEMWDTEAMSNADGFVPAGPPFMGRESVAAMRHSIREAKRLGLELGLVTSSGWNAGGPWVPPHLASKNLFVSTEVVTGPGEITRKLAFPEVPRECPKRPDGLPQWWREVAVLAWPESADRMIVDPARIIDLTGMTDQGELRWTPPPGDWRVARFVCTNNGQQLIAASPNSKGPFIDFLDPAATRFHFEFIIGKLGLAKGGDPSPLKYLEVDSMELHEGIQWTPGFPEWFKQHFGYDPVRWLPVLAGWTVTDRETSDRFQYDYRKAVSELLIFSHYTTGNAVCAQYGLGLAGEAGGPGPPIWDTCPVDALRALGEMTVARGEFWIDSRDKHIFLIKEIASAAHIYGKTDVDAEAWTTWRRWNNSPYLMKLHVDRAFCEGLNRITYHGFCHSPPKFGFPGRAYHAGVDMNPRVVWWEKSRPFMDYLSRCCQLLRQGLFVADVAYYYGDQAPNFWPPFHKVPEIPRMPGLGAGYDYDVVNSDVILRRMSVRGGRIVLPDGMSYRVLVLPEQSHMPLEVLRKLDELVREGATILGPKPSAVPGLRDHASNTAELRRIAATMWGADNVAPNGGNPHGKGRVEWGISAREWLERAGIGPDFSGSHGDQHLEFIHRRTPHADIYFVRNRSSRTVSEDCLFRVHERFPQRWNPDDGSVENVMAYSVEKGGTRLRLDLPPGGSTFVVFTEGSAPTRIASVVRSDGVTDPSLPTPQVVAADDTGVTVRCWSDGSHEMTDASGLRRTFQADGIGGPSLISGPWKVAFDPAWGAPASVEFPELVSWTDHAEFGVRHYSGTGTYLRPLEVAAGSIGEGKRLWLDLGEVRDVAEVHVNGRSAGILWKPPYRVELTALVKPGANELRIEVMNQWINRLVGDQQLPPEKRLTRTNIKKGDGWELHPAGLLGPVRVLSSRDVRVR